MAQTHTHSYFLIDDGSLYVRPVSKPSDASINEIKLAVGIPDGEKVSQLAAGLYHLLVLTESGHVYGAGISNMVHLAPLNYEKKEAFEPVILPDGKLAKAIAGGTNHSLILLSDGSVLAAGLNAQVWIT